nr:hypothetical protein [Mesorhizobium sp.]
MVSARLVFLAALQAADHQTNLGPADPDVPQEGIVHRRKRPFRHTVNPVVPERAVSCSHYRHCNTPLIGAAGCSVAIAFKPSLFQAFFRAKREVFRLFQRRGSASRGVNSELPESCGKSLLSWRWMVKPASTISHAGSCFRWQHRDTDLIADYLLPR